MEIQEQLASNNYFSPYLGGNILQPSHETRMNRFPKMFSRAKRLRPNPKRILSFGCSTGEECQTLSEYFPESPIHGVDLDAYCISRAKNNNKSDKITFSTSLKGTGQFDLVFCMMVFFFMENPISFDAFSETFKKLDKHVEDDAILIVYTSEYDPLTTKVGRNYMAVKQWKRIHNKNKKEYFCGYYLKVKHDSEG